MVTAKLWSFIDCDSVLRVFEFMLIEKKKCANYNNMSHKERIQINHRKKGILREDREEKKWNNEDFSNNENGKKRPKTIKSMLLHSMTGGNVK